MKHSRLTLFLLPLLLVSCGALWQSDSKSPYELARTGGRYGLITMCIGGGQGIAAVIERM